MSFDPNENDDEHNIPVVLWPYVLYRWANSFPKNNDNNSNSEVTTTTLVDPRTHLYKQLRQLFGQDEAQEGEESIEAEEVQEGNSSASFPTEETETETVHETRNETENDTAAAVTATTIPSTATAAAVDMDTSNDNDKPAPSPNKATKQAQPYDDFVLDLSRVRPLGWPSTTTATDPVVAETTQTATDATTHLDENSQQPLVKNKSESESTHEDEEKKNENHEIDSVENPTEKNAHVVDQENLNLQDTTDESILEPNVTMTAEAVENPIEQIEISNESKRPSQPVHEQQQQRQQQPDVVDLTETDESLSIVATIPSVNEIRYLKPPPQQRLREHEQQLHATNQEATTNISVPNEKPSLLSQEDQAQLEPSTNQLLLLHHDKGRTRDYMCLVGEHYWHDPQAHVLVCRHCFARVQLNEDARKATAHLLLTCPHITTEDRVMIHEGVKHAIVQQEENGEAKSKALLEHSNQTGAAQVAVGPLESATANTEEQNTNVCESDMNNNEQSMSPIPLEADANVGEGPRQFESNNDESTSPLPFDKNVDVNMTGEEMEQFMDGVLGESAFPNAQNQGEEQNESAATIDLKHDSSNATCRDETDSPKKRRRLNDNEPQPTNVSDAQHNDISVAHANNKPMSADSESAENKSSPSLREFNLLKAQLASERQMNLELQQQLKDKERPAIQALKSRLSTLIQLRTIENEQVGQALEPNSGSLEDQSVSADASPAVAAPKILLDKTQQRSEAAFRALSKLLEESDTCEKFYKARLEGCSAQLENCRSHYSKSRLAVHQLRAEATRNATRLQDSTRQLHITLSQNQNWKSQVSVLTSSVQQLQASLRQGKEYIQKLTVALRNSHTQNQNLKSSAAESAQQLHTQRVSIERLTKEVHSHKSHEQQWLTIKNTLQERIQHLDSARKSLQEKLDLASQQAKSTSDTKELEAKLAERNAKVQQCLQLLKQQEVKRKSQTSQLVKSFADMKQLTKERDEYKRKLQTLTANGNSAQAPSHPSPPSPPSQTGQARASSLPAAVAGRAEPPNNDLTAPAAARDDTRRALEQEIQQLRQAYTELKEQIYRTNGPGAWCD